MKVMVTGGAGFIGSALIRWIYRNLDWKVLNIDALTYAGSLETLADVPEGDRYSFKCLDIRHAEVIRKAFFEFQPDYVVHLAAETHVDRSIDGPLTFLETNILGTYNLLQGALEYYQTLDVTKKSVFRFHHVSTDEVYGSLGAEGYFHEETPYQPNSPYSASKAASDHFVRAWHKTFGLPVTLSNCSNNYGPFQFPEKIIPLMVLNAIEGKSLPVYGSGENIRDWLYVDDHVQAIITILQHGRLGECYNVGGDEEIRNIDLVNKICDSLDGIFPDSPNAPHKQLITFVEDRPGHDLRYAIDASKIKKELGWMPNEDFKSGLEKTIQWYLQNKNWWKDIQSGSYQGERLGLRSIG